MQSQPVVAHPTGLLPHPEPSRDADVTEVPQLVGGRYRVLSLRGSGAEASVYLATDLFTDQEVALKVGAPGRLAAEYRRGAELAHPHLARALVFWRGAGASSLAFEYGAEDLTVLRGAPEPEVVRHVAGIARALSYLHRRGIVHGDVKPQNAVLAGPSAARRALLVDLGLAGAESAARGSLEYAAPEVLQGAPPDAASDLYSLGATLHELLSGSNPFAAAGNPAGIIRAHFETPAAPRASPGVQAVVSKLLAREPRSRYAHADEVIEALAAATGLPLESEGEGLAPDRIGLGQMYGREAELARIETAAGNVAGGDGEQLLLVGASGSGRSRLLRASAVLAELAGLRTFHLNQGEGLDVLCRRLGLLLGLGHGLGGHFEASVGLARERLSAACAQHPLALLVDDADRSSDGLAAVLLAIARDPIWKVRPLLVVAASSRPPIDSNMERLELQPLAPSVGKAKVAEALGSRSWADGLAERIMNETSGHPRELEDALRDLAARRLLVRQRGRWELDLLRAGPRFAGCIPRASARGAREAVLALPKAEQSELGFLAVLWPELDAKALAGHESDLVAAGLRVAEALNLRLSQLALLQAAESALSPGERRRAHLRAAAMAQDAAGRVHQLFRAKAGGVVRAAIAAAHARTRAGEPLDAARFYQIAVAALHHPLRSARAALLCERAGDCLALAGHPGEARHAYARALDRGGTAARIWQKIAKARWQEGKFDKVLEAISRARGEGADLLATATVEARAEAMLGNYPRAEELARTALPLARQRGDGEAATRLHHLLGTSAWHRGEGRRAAVEERIAVLIARRFGDRRAEADARSGLGTAWRILARYDRSARETLRAIDLYRALGDERQEAISWNNLGVARYLAGQWEGALEAWEKLTEKDSQTLEEELLTLNNLGFLYRERGDSPRARELLGRALEKIQASGGYARIEAMVRGNLGEVAAREGDLATAEKLYGQTLEIALAIGARDEVVETERRRCELDLLRADPAGAAARAGEALNLAAGSGNLIERGNLWRILALAARARGDGAAAADAAAKAHESLRSAGAALEDARTDCVECLLGLDRGDPVGATAALRRARTVFESLGAAPDLREIDRLQTDVDALHRKSFSHVEALTQAAQRLAARTDPAAMLEDALDEALLLTGAERGFILLKEGTGEPRVAAVRGASPGSVLRISRTVADRVLNSGEMLAVADIVGHEELSTRKSILDLGLRSVLCAPIRFGGRQLGILYVDSRRVGSLLSEKDLALLSAFAALAGSALENARLIDDLRRKTELLAHMAHEFRSPLNGITGYAELVKLDAGLGPRGRRGMEVISSQAMRLANIVGRTLELSQMEAGAVSLVRDQVDLAEVAKAAIEGLDPLALMKSIQVDLSAEASVPKVAGDFDRLVQVITNLVGNAIHYSGEGTSIAVRVASGEPLAGKARPRIEVEGAPPGAESQAPPLRSVQVVVTDHGPGIAAEDIPRLFTPFFRGGTGTGTGLGLVISREIVREHGGEIRVESKLGEGTTFAVVLPGFA
jgi:signal transduction histidine kinase